MFYRLRGTRLSSEIHRICLVISRSKPKVKICLFWPTVGFVRIEIMEILIIVRVVAVIGGNGLPDPLLKSGHSSIDSYVTLFTTV